MTIPDINMDDLWEDLHGLVGDEGYEDYYELDDDEVIWPEDWEEEDD